MPDISPESEAVPISMSPTEATTFPPGTTILESLTRVIESRLRVRGVPVKFIEGEYMVPACYYEFAERFRAKDGEIFSGFIAESADKIFESTDFYEGK